MMLSTLVRVLALRRGHHGCLGERASSSKVTRRRRRWGWMDKIKVARYAFESVVVFGDSVQAVWFRHSIGP